MNTREPISVDDYIAYEAFKKGITIKGYEDPARMFWVLRQTESLDSAIEFIQKVNDLDTMLGITSSIASESAINESLIQYSLDLLKRCESLMIVQENTSSEDHERVAEIYAGIGNNVDAERHYVIAGKEKTWFDYLLSEGEYSMESYALAVKSIDECEKRGVHSVEKLELLEIIRKSG